MGSYKDPTWRSEMQDPYCCPESKVLKNKLGVQSNAQLSELEPDSALFRLRDLEKKPVEGIFDFKHLKEIHRRIFGDVYEWAGKLRTIDMSKDGSLFARHDMMDSFLDTTFKKMNKERMPWGKPGQPSVPEGIANYLADVNSAHPFREGNGRTQRVFFGELAKANGLELTWGKANQEEMIAASNESFTGPNASLHALVRRCASPDKTIYRQGKNARRVYRYKERDNER